MTSAAPPSVAELQETFSSACDFHRRGDLASARRLYEEILRSQPGHFDTLHLLGVIAAQSGHAAHALELLDRAVLINRHSAGAHFNRATALQALGRRESALAGYDRAIGLDAALAPAHSNRGVVLRDLGRMDAALASYDRAIAADPTLAQAHFNRSALLHELGNPQVALAGYDRAVALRADYAEAWCNRGNVLRDLDRIEAAVASYDKAIALDAGYALAHCNRGNALAEQRQFDAAFHSYDRAIALQDDLAEAHFNRSIALLTTGNFLEGWPAYEWRWKNCTAANFEAARAFDQPLWLGHESLAGKTIVLHAEQGLGDTLQFCRYAKLVADLGATVILEVPKPLASLLRQLEGVAAIVVRGDALPAAHYHCPLMSLPLAFQTTPGTVPSPVRYLRGDAAATARWSAMLGPKTGPRVGLAWRGNPRNANDRKRSLSLRQLAAALPPGVQYISLHKELDEADRQILRTRSDIVDFSDHQSDFQDAAALCECLDLVISVDTSLAHLGGALARNTWVLLPFNADWRWSLDREDSAWYPTATLYRQPRPGDWDSVLQRVAAALLALHHE